LKINISQGSVAPQLMCGDIFEGLSIRTGKTDACTKSKEHKLPMIKYSKHI